jgi:hypothetical protein
MNAPLRSNFIYICIQLQCKILNVLIIFQGATQLKDLQVDKHTNYTHHSSTKEFQQSLVEVVVDELVSEVGESGVFSIMLDESTDVSVS